MLGQERNLFGAFPQGRHFNVDNIQDHYKDCVANLYGDGPKILSPQENYEYYVEDNSGAKILLHAVSNKRVKKHYWYINDKLIVTCNPGEKTYFSPTKTKNKIICIDDLGQSSEVQITVKRY